MTAKDNRNLFSAAADPVAFRRWYEARARAMLRSPDARIQDIGRRMLLCLDCNRQLGATRCDVCRGLT